MSMLENLKKLEAEGKVGGSDYYKVQEDNNIVRVLSEGVFYESEYKNPKTGEVKVNNKFVMFLIDRRDGKVKPYFAPYTVYKQIAQLETDPFYSFQGMPMPYDVNIKTENAGDMTVKYNVQASPQKTELTGEEIAAAQKAGSIHDYVAGLDKVDGKPQATSDDAPLPQEPGATHA